MNMSRTSGDLLADRRFAYAERLAAEGDLEAAADLLAQTIERVPGWVPAWLALGLAREKQGRLEGARRAFAEAAALDASGVYGASLHAARLGGGAAPPAMPAAYVAALFDDYAFRFDRHLLDTLGYRGPALLGEALTEVAGTRRFGDAVDLGCGTGLMGAAIRPRVDRLTGVDLSGGMIEQARKRGLYDRLAVDDILHFLGTAEAASADLVLAADVFAYLGPIEPVIAAIAPLLRPAGILAFTVQRGTDDVRLGSDMRFSHAPGHVRTALDRAGLQPTLLREASTRRDAGLDVPGLVVLSRRG